MAAEWRLATGAGSGRARCPGTERAGVVFNTPQGSVRKKKLCLDPAMVVLPRLREDGEVISGAGLGQARRPREFPSASANRVGPWALEAGGRPIAEAKKAVAAEPRAGLLSSPHKALRFPYLPPTRTPRHQFSPFSYLHFIQDAFGCSDVPARCAHLPPGKSLDPASFLHTTHLPPDRDVVGSATEAAARERVKKWFRVQLDHLVAVSGGEVGARSVLSFWAESLRSSGADLARICSPSQAPLGLRFNSSKVSGPVM